VAPNDVDWPGLGIEHKDGYEVHPEHLKRIGQDLVVVFDEVYGKLLKPFDSGDAMRPSRDWNAAKTASSIISRFEEHVCCLTGDTMMDTMAAGGLVASCGETPRPDRRVHHERRFVVGPVVGRRP
jgi:hypothetical protein